MRDAREWPTLVDTIGEGLQLTETEYHETQRTADQEAVRCEHPHASVEGDRRGRRAWVCPDCGLTRQAPGERK